VAEINAMKYISFASKDVANGTANSWYVTHKNWPEENAIVVFVTNGATTSPTDLMPMRWDNLKNLLPNPGAILFNGDSGIQLFDIGTKTWRSLP
jgi:hypothetical protein